SGRRRAYRSELGAASCFPHLVRGSDQDLQEMRQAIHEPIEAKYKEFATGRRHRCFGLLDREAGRTGRTNGRPGEAYIETAVKACDTSSCPFEQGSTMAKHKKPGALVPSPLAGYGSLVAGISELLDQARRTAVRTVNSILTATYWEVGRRIVEFEQAGRA